MLIHVSVIVVRKENQLHFDLRFHSPLQALELSAEILPMSTGTNERLKPVKE